MSIKLCNKGGYHTDRPIQAVCLQKNCSSDRLLCFYCKHQSHRDHQTAYFPTGLSGSLQLINQNSRYCNVLTQQKKINKKFRYIKKGWQRIQYTMDQYLYKIQNQLNLCHDTISKTFSPTSVLEIKHKLSSQQLQQNEIQKMVRMINQVNQFQLNNKQKVMIMMKLKQRVLKEVFQKTAEEVKLIMKQIQTQSKNYQFTSNHLGSIVDKGLQTKMKNQQHKQSQQKQQNSKITQSDYEDQLKQYQTYFSTEMTQSQIQDESYSEQQLKQFYDFKPEDQSQFQKIELNFNPNKQLYIQQKNNQKLSQNIIIKSHDNNQKMQKNLKVKISKNIIQMTNNIQLIDQYSKFYDKQKDHITNNRQFILKNKHFAQNYHYQDEQAQNYEYCDRNSQNQQFYELSKSKKKVKYQFSNNNINTNNNSHAFHNYRSRTYSQQQYQRKKQFKEKMQNVFGQDDNQQSQNQQSQDNNHQQKEVINVGYNFKDKNLSQIQEDSAKINIVAKKKKFQGFIYQPAQNNYKKLHLQQNISQNVQKQIKINAKKEQKLFNDILKPYNKVKSESMKYNPNGYVQIQKRMIKVPENYKQNHTDYIAESKQSNDSGFIFRNIRVCGSNQQQIFENLKLIDSLIIEKLQIYGDSTTCCVDFECIDIISKMKGLKSLCIYMTHGLNAKQVKKIIVNLNQLEELVLCEFNQVDLQIAKLIKKNLPKLKRFYYSVDYKNYMQKMQQNFQFFIDITPPPTNLQALRVLSTLPFIETVQLINIPNEQIHQIPQILRNIQNLKQITITNSDQILLDYTEIIEQLAQTRKNLTVLCLQNITLKQSDLIEIFKKNKYLHTLIINQCLQLQNSTMQILFKSCQYLQQLSLMLIDSINGKQVYSCEKLRTLIIRACWKFDNTFFCKNIHKLKNLQCLSVTMNCYWFYDHLMKQIVKLHKLKILNIDTTKITDLGIKEIYKLSKLETFICGKTEISFEGLLKSLQNPVTGAKNHNIRKLGLAKDPGYTKEVQKKRKKNKHDIMMKDFHAKQLVTLGRILPNLTHLSIGGFRNPQRKYFETLTNLKCLSAQRNQMPTEVENQLQRKGIYLCLQYQ